MEVVKAIRAARHDLNAGARDTILVNLRRVAEDPAATLLDGDYGRDAIVRLADAEHTSDAPAGRTLVVGGLEIRVGARAAAPSDHAGLEREVTAARSKIDRLEQQLANQQFVSKANPEVVQRARDDLIAARERLAILEDAFSRA